MQLPANALAGMGVSLRVAPSRELLRKAVRRAGGSRSGGQPQAIYRRPGRSPTGRRRRPGEVDRVVLVVARENPTDATRMGRRDRCADVGWPWCQPQEDAAADA
jgi:hypothetical protein